MEVAFNPSTMICTKWHNLKTNKMQKSEANSVLLI